MKVTELTEEQKAKRTERHKKWRQAHFLERREYMREYMREYVKTPEGRERAKKYEAAYRERQKAMRKRIKELMNGD